MQEKPDPCFGHIAYMNGAITLYAFNLHTYATGLILFLYFRFEKFSPCAFLFNNDHLKKNCLLGAILHTWVYCLTFWLTILVNWITRN